MICPYGNKNTEELVTLKIEGLTITKPKLCTTYKEAKGNIPKGFRLPEQWELFKIFSKMKNRKKLSDKTYMFFWSSLIEDNYVKGLCLSRNLDMSSGDENLADSSSYGRVIWIKVTE